MTSIIHVIYQEANPANFSGFVINYPNQTTELFAGKDPVETYKRLKEFVESADIFCLVSSDVDKFVQETKNEELAKLIYG